MAVKKTKLTHTIARDDEPTKQDDDDDDDDDPPENHTQKDTDLLR